MLFRLADHGLVFSVRDRGRKIRTELLEERSGSETVAIDFAEVLSASYSFIDEFIGELASQDPDAIDLLNVPPTIVETIERSLRRRGIDVQRVLTASLVA